MEDIKVLFKKLLECGKVRGHIAGPKNNVLVCDTMRDWVIASGEVAQEGYDVTSPGGYGGASPSSRANTHNKIWRSGTVCAAVIEKRVLVFSLPQTTYDYCSIVHEKKVDSRN